MPRSKVEPNTFIAGALPIVGVGEKRMFVDGRMQELRNVNDFSDRLSYSQYVESKEFTSAEDDNTIMFEFFGKR